MQQKEMLYEGKGKKLYKTDDENLVISEFKDDLTAFNAEKRGSEQGKGILNCKISSEIFKLLEKNGIKTHYVETLADNLMLCKFVKIIPIEVVVRNIATGSLSKRLGIKEGEALPFTLVEFYYKDDALGDPLINDEHALILNCVKSVESLDVLRKIGREVNSVLREFFDKKNLILVDFKLEFGVDKDGNILLADEITPDSCRFWDKDTKEKLDKDRFRQDLGNVKMAYEEILKRILN
ncbi:phosphoribosylaminoimidazolesuccinocarboxamide synthase [Helicobacter winghamensis]|uniref:Phosphoribosylaminoimidazole-succinocarboxamide synthase n=1 Tax=Helicobacter winghamensis TaxID=157268 RepID=A0A2N3PJS7_9HELI|nr:phosphoribosylaminoimidazolesuccinocarboxamide synthase [Helicobacter winghamensis]EEO26249.1 phosphoribosylaminoimidazolesuccinocarboxamide synthase [Helicobacter winghamensis ATCC BAA-430]PKT77243.1 phosphoribosylaminoimidazolesuccinocarboxamide synthase [Helicobacter winghamensis]PKT77443.1 phosphoribosylaminoimidazolesuccinocarboxamide synthase [Helicobacter winghamensis]PKT77824.1 phosphoribosylaminoimidazolesuccinocarboxamide synthase [Helicobacter winghamensis]PKT81409.1 phosphoribos